MDIEIQKQILADEKVANTLKDLKGKLEAEVRPILEQILETLKEITSCTEKVALDVEALVGLDFTVTPYALTREIVASLEFPEVNPGIDTLVKREIIEEMFKKALSEFS